MNVATIDLSVMSAASRHSSLPHCFARLLAAALLLAAVLAPRPASASSTVTVSDGTDVAIEGVAHTAEEAGADATRPNILWIALEDASPQLGAYGDPQADTPNIDAFAQEGVVYTNATSSAPVCAPARSALATGMYSTSFGAHNMRSTGKLPPGIQLFSGYLNDAGYYTTNNSKEDYNFEAPSSTWDESSGSAHWRNRPREDQPFFSMFSFNDSHESRVKNLPGTTDHDPDALTLPPYYPDTDLARRVWARYYDVLTNVDREVGDLLQQLEDDGLSEETIVFVFSDHGAGVPRAKRWVYDSGVRVPLVVRIPSQFRQGDQGQPGTVEDELVSFVDFAPTVLNLAGAAIPDHMQGRAFLGANLSQERSYLYDARDRMDERYDMIRATRGGQYKYIRNYEAHKPYYQYMQYSEEGDLMKEIRRLDESGGLPAAAAQYMTDTKPEEELYDLEADPHEVNNLADAPAYQAVLDRMRAAHDQWAKETKDVGIIPEPVLRTLEEESNTDIYTLVRQGGVSLERMKDVAVLAQDATAGAQLKAALGDSEAGVRYWAAVGLGNQEVASAQRELEQALGDAAPVVRIAAARALAKIGQVNAALPTLTSELKSSDEWVRVHAANVLDYMDRQAISATPELEAATQDGSKYVVRVARRALNELEEIPAGGGPIAVPFRLNVGGPDLTTSLGAFSADAFATGSSEVSSKDFDVAGTEDDDLYLVYRYATKNEGGPGDDFGYAMPLANGPYTVRLHFVEPHFGAPGGPEGGEGSRVFSVDLEGGRVIDELDVAATTGSGEALVRTVEGVEVSDGMLDVTFVSQVNNAIVSAIEVLPYEEPPVAGACAPYSTLDCAEVSAELPFSLSFDGSEGGLTDGSSAGTGFTMAAPQSAFDPDASGYDPGRLSLDAAGSGTLTLSTTAGIFYQQPGQTGGAPNEQLNALGVAFEAGSSSGLITVETALANLPASASSDKKFEQAGLYFGLGDQSYVKLVVIANGDNGADYNAQLGYELGDVYDSDVAQNTESPVFAPGDDAVLRLELNPGAETAAGYYSADGGSSFEQIGGVISIDASLFAGLDLDGDAATDPVSLAGVMATHRNGSSLDFAFERFSITPEGGPPATETRTLAMNAGWNLVGLPLAVADASAQSVFPAASEGSLFAYDEGYQARAALAAGRGYWLRFDAAASQEITGQAIETLEVAVQPGWNLIAGTSCPVERATLGGGEALSEAPLFAYDEGYQSAQALLPGRAYWAEATQAGTLTLACSAEAAPALAAASKQRRAQLSAARSGASGFGRLRISDAAGSSQQLFFGASAAQAKSRAWAMPPLPPRGVFDARFATDMRLTEGAEALIAVQTSARPLRVALEAAPGDAAPQRAGTDAQGAEYVLEALSERGQVLSTRELVAGETAEVTASEAVQLRLRPAEALPGSFALLGNAPNPFRDQTAVVFDAPEASEVRLEVYDVLGRRVMEVPARRIEAGARRSVRVEGRRLASGTYFYRLTLEGATETRTETGRITLVK